ncbi:MAG: hypothetical protein OSA98_03565 [Rubripirellula sp.]|nr:hypothetical protein [Rubripirellula sp.]
MSTVLRRSLLKYVAVSPWIINRVMADTTSETNIPKYQIGDTAIEFHTTDGYPQRWKETYENTIKHFSNRWGRVGPTHIFLVENTDWNPEPGDPARVEQLKISQRQLKQTFAKLQGHGSDGSHLEWETGNHWAGWSIKPPQLMITMTMSPYRDADQFVIGPIHEYMHALQTAHGYGQEAIDGNRMGQSLWTGPAWWREGAAVLVSAVYSYQTPSLFKSMKRNMSWRRLSDEMNRNLEMYQKIETSISSGVTHDDWQRLEAQQRVHPVVYAGGSVACAHLLKRAGSLDKFMQFLPKVAKLGWQPAFEQHFGISLPAFYEQFAKDVATAEPRQHQPPSEDNWCYFLKSIK